MKHHLAQTETFADEIEYLVDWNTVRKWQNGIEKQLFLGKNQNLILTFFFKEDVEQVFAQTGQSIW